MENYQKWFHDIDIGRALDLGAGEGEIASWLAERGFLVDAVESDAQIYRRLLVNCKDSPVRPHHTDLLHFPMPPSSYELIVAQAVLHFLRPTQLWPLADRLVATLTLGGIFLAEVFTTDDPGCKALKNANALEIEPNTFETGAPTGLIHYFAPGELRRVFSALDVLEYEESRRADPDSDDGFRAGAHIVARRPLSA